MWKFEFYTRRKASKPQGRPHRDSDFSEKLNFLLLHFLCELDLEEYYGAQVLTTQVIVANLVLLVMHHA